MKKRHSNKQRGHAMSKAGHGDLSKQHGKPMDPADHVAHDLKGLPTQKYQGQGLGTEPSQAQMPQTMQGPAQYPGQDIGA